MIRRLKFGNIESVKTCEGKSGRILQFRQYWNVGSQSRILGLIRLLRNRKSETLNYDTVSHWVHVKYLPLSHPDFLASQNPCNLPTRRRGDSKLQSLRPLHDHPALARTYIYII